MNWIKHFHDYYTDIILIWFIFARFDLKSASLTRFQFHPGKYFWSKICSAAGNDINVHHTFASMQIFHWKSQKNWAAPKQHSQVPRIWNIEFNAAERLFYLKLTALLLLYWSPLYFLYKRKQKLGWTVLIELSCLRPSYFLLWS